MIYPRTGFIRPDTDCQWHMTDTKLRIRCYRWLEGSSLTPFGWFFLRVLPGELRAEFLIKIHSQRPALRGTAPDVTARALDTSTSFGNTWKLQADTGD